jgi:para-nitrobenzyl esterase
MNDKIREFKDLVRFDQYDYLNSEITGGYDEAHAVKCVNGTFVGTEEYGVASWLGIPYAKAPVGERRFKAPEYVDASDHVFEAKYYGKGAYGSLGYPDCVQKLESEDCLYLNIWVNTDDKTEKKPVMFWIHGGAYVVGSGSEASYSGANLVQAHSDIIMVNINYRLNMYGFMDFSSVPGGENFKTAPCNGLLDQAMALRWVHENIAAFGGDPDNVTIFGQSAGGGSVSILPVMKEANQYFQKVIAQSGSTTLAFPVGCKSAQGKTKALLEYTGCKTMDDIMALSEEKLQEAYVNAVGQFTSCPYYGTEVLPEAPIELYKKGYAKHISIMAGSTADEARLFMGEGVNLSMEEQKLFAQRAVGDAANCLKEEDKKYYEQFKRVCRTPEPGLVETEFINELMFRVPMLQQLDVQSAFNKTFCYYWSYPGSNPDVGAAHSVELIFVFNLRGIGTNSPFNGTNISDEIFTTVLQMWTNFARCGNPSTDKIEWKAYSADDQNVMIIAGPGDIRIEQGLLAEQYKAVTPLVSYYQFMDNYFTPHYLLDIVGARETRKEEKHGN